MQITFPAVSQGDTLKKASRHKKTCVRISPGRAMTNQMAIAIFKIKGVSNA